MPSLVGKLTEFNAIIFDFGYRYCHLEVGSNKSVVLFEKAYASLSQFPNVDCQLDVAPVEDKFVIRFFATSPEILARFSNHITATFIGKFSRVDLEVLSNKTTGMQRK